jgi:hypothetical protein
MKKQELILLLITITTFTFAQDPLNAVTYRKVGVHWKKPDIALKH